MSANRAGSLGQRRGLVARGRRRTARSPIAEGLERRELLTINFGPPSLISSLASDIRDIATGDFSGSGLPDIAAASANDSGSNLSGAATLFENRGGGTFGTPLPVSLPPNPQRIVAADFNGDGHPDLASTNGPFQAMVDVALGRGDGTFDPPVAYEVSAGTGTAIIAADIDDDGWVDIVAAAGNSDLSVLRSLGDGTFGDAGTIPAQNTTSLATGDFNGDGLPDLLLGQYGGPSLVVRLNQGGAFPVGATYLSDAVVFAVGTGDFDGDGDLDLVASTDSALRVFLNLGDGTFGEPQIRPLTSTANDIAVGDFDGDGRADLALAMFNGPVQVLPGQGDGRFGATLLFDTSANFGTSIAAVDLTGSGRLDLVYNSRSELRAMLNTSPPTAAGSLEFSSVTYAAAEGGGPATISVVRTGGSTGAVSVQYATSAGTATSGVQYLDVSGTLEFADGETVKTFSVPILNDTNGFPAPFLTVNLGLSMTTGGAVVGTPASAVLQIVDNAPRMLSISDVTVDEFAEQAFFTVTSNYPVGTPITVHVATADGTAKAGVDYIGLSSELTLDTGMTSRTFFVFILPNPLVKPSNVFSVFLSDATNAGIAKAQGIGTIIDQNAPVVAQGATIVGTQNVPFSATVASFTDPNGTGDVAIYSASIDWGDGSAPSTGTVVRDVNTFSVVGSHLYADAGPHAIKATILRRGADPSLVFSQANVGPNVIVSQSAGDLAATAGTRLADVTVATFVDRGGVEPAATYLASIDWGDGTPPSAGFVTARPPVPPTENPGSGDYGVYAVQGSHTYATPGSYRVVVTIRGDNGAVSSTSGLVEVRDVVPPPVQVFDGPKVTGVVFDRTQGRVVIGLKGTDADLDLSSVMNSANFRLTRRGGYVGQFTVTGIAIGAASADGTREVTLTINGGKRKLPTGNYLLQVFAGGIVDRRGLTLDGEFYGTWPSGDGKAGGDFAARMIAYRKVVGAPIPVLGYVPPKGRAGGPAVKNRVEAAGLKAVAPKPKVPAGPARLSAPSRPAPAGR